MTAEGPLKIDYEVKPSVGMAIEPATTSVPQKGGSEYTERIMCIMAMK